MTKKKLIFIIAACVLVLLCVFVGVYFAVSGANESDPTDPSETTGTPDAMSYTIEVKSSGGKLLEGIGVYVYTDETQQELVWFAKTDANGVITFTDVASDSFIAVLDGVPEGYEVEAVYPVTGEMTQIVLPGGLAEVENLEEVTFQLGDLMADFTVTTPDGTEYTLSELLKEKQAVVLNFWYVQCQPCRMEFPYLQEAYEKYSDSIEVLALNPVNQDDPEIAAFQEELGLTFPVAKCDPAMESAMQLTAYPTTVVIDRFGTIAMIHKGSVTETQTFLNIFDYFAAEDYVQTVVENVEDLPVAEDTTGTIDNPTEIGAVDSFQVTVKPEQVVYVDIYKVNNLYFQIVDPDVYVIYNNNTYYPSNGTLGLVINAPDTYTPVKMGIGNAGKETKVFTATMGQFPGTMNNPFELKLGEFSIKVNSGNDQGVYFAYQADKDGVFTVKCTSATSGIDYDFTLYNLNTYAYRTASGEGTVGADGARSVSIQVKKGNTVQFSVGTLPDSSKNYPAGTFVFEASLAEGAVIDGGEQVKQIDYSITVTDQDRTPLPGVFFSLSVDGAEKNISTNQNGVASIKLPAGTYNATLVVPDGYKAYTTDYILTENIPTFSVKLDEIIIVKKTYTVKVVDEKGSPVPGVLVAVDTGFAYTDNKGLASFPDLNEGEYSAMIVVPSGYTSDAMTYPFPEEATELTIKLKKDTGEQKPTEPSKPSDPSEPTAPTEPQEVNYSVSVKDYSGQAKTGVVVQFLKGSSPVAMQPVNASGVAAAKLQSGDYTVKLVFSGETLYYEEKDAVLSPGKNSITLKVAPAVSGTPEELYVGNAYKLDVGGTYVKLQSNATNYFIFAPTRAGVYKFTTSDPAAKIGYFGGNTFFIQDMTNSTDYKDNAFTRNVKEGNLGSTYILGVTGAEDCIIEITRISDPILDETDVVPVVYKAKTPPKQFTLSLGGKKLTEVDITAATEKYVPVYNESDGYYHLNSKTGPVLYVNLGPDAKYVSMYNMLGFTGFGGTSLMQYFYDDSGKLEKREDYTECMTAYVECIDGTYGVYPLTEDLKYMLQQGGDFKGWWDSGNENYLFGEVSGLNTEIAWMFAVCYLN